MNSLRNPEFIKGMAAGAVAVYAFHWFRAKKAAAFASSSS